MRVRRRTAVAAPAAAVLGLTACTDDASSPPTTTSSPTASAAVEPDADRAALDRASALTTDLLDTLAAAPQLDPGGRFLALHTAHLEALDRAAGPSASASPSAGLPLAVGPRAFRRQELAAQRELAHLALDAASGALARLLASMSAGIAAHLAAR